MSGFGTSGAPRRGILVALAAIFLLLGLPGSASAARDTSDGSVCSGLTKAEKGLCNAYCRAQQCPDRDPERRSCENLRDHLFRATGSSVFPCDAEPSLCGNGIVDPEAWEECDGEDDVVCPGLCLPPGSDGACTCGGDVPAPALLGLQPDKPRILPVTVQAAYNDDTMFFNIEWDADRGDYHDYVHYTSGAWQQEGCPRRDAQATLDNDPRRGKTNCNSTIYESRVTFMVNDPSGPNAVPEFNGVGCFATCHDDSRAMPTWDSSTDQTKYLNDGTVGVLDLWHRRLHRANPIGASDDQHVTRIPPGGATGGRFGDAGNSPWQTNNIVAGEPTYALDPDTTHGLFAFDFDDVFRSPYRYFRREDAAELGAGPVPVGIAFADALTMGYVPQEGDTIPRRRLRKPTESRGDISGFESTFTPSLANPLIGHIETNTQRLLDTGHPDDTALADGGVYDIAFAVHLGMVTVRDHYVSFRMKLALGDGNADIEAVNVPGSGSDLLPDFSDTNRFPEKEVNLFMPGIASFEFLDGTNASASPPLMYIDPVTGSAVDQRHGGANGIANGLRCRDCHTAANSDPFEPTQPGGFFAGPMESLAPQRGGVNTPTPIPPVP